MYHVFEYRLVILNGRNRKSPVKRFDKLLELGTVLELKQRADRPHKAEEKQPAQVSLAQLFALIFLCRYQTCLNEPALFCLPEIVVKTYSETI